MNTPDKLKYTKEHEWVRVEDNIAFIGMTDFAQGELGDVVFLEIETQGQELKKDDIFGTIEAVKTVSDLFMPVSGKVLEVNPELEDKPELINEDPYGKGWMIKISLNDPSEPDSLLSAEKYQELIG